MAIRGGASTAALSKLMGGKGYRQAQARGEKSATGTRLKQRRKKIRDMAIAEIEAAEKEWKDKMKKASKSKSGGFWGNISSALGLGSMFLPWLAPLSMAAQAKSVDQKKKWLSGDTMKEYKKNVLDKIDVGKYKNTFMEEYVKGSEDALGDAWSTSVDRMKSSLTGGLMQNLIFQLGTMGMGQGVGKNGSGLTMPKLDFKDFFSNFGEKMQNFNLNPAQGNMSSAIGPGVSPISTGNIVNGQRAFQVPSSPIPLNPNLSNQPDFNLFQGGQAPKGQASPFGMTKNPFEFGQGGWGGALTDPNNLARLGAASAQYWQPGYNFADLLMGASNVFEQSGNRPSNQAPSWLANFNTGFWN